MRSKREQERRAFEARGVEKILKEIEFQLEYTSKNGKVEDYMYYQKQYTIYNMKLEILLQEQKNVGMEEYTPSL